MPVTLADRFEHAFDHLRERRGVRRLEPLADAETVAVLHVDLVECLPLVVAHDVAVHGLPAPEVVDRVQQLQRSRVALVAHLRDPVRVLVDRTQFGGEEGRCVLQSRALRIAQVRDVQLWVASVEEAHGARDAPQVFERVIGVEQAAQVRRAREHGGVRAAQMLGVRVDGPASAVLRLRAPARGVGTVTPRHARQVQLLEPAVAFFPMVRRQRRLGDVRSVVAALVAEDPRQRRVACRLRIDAAREQQRRDALDIGAHRVVVGLLVERCGEHDRARQKFHHVRELVAVQPGDRDHGVDPRPAEFVERDRLDAGHATARVPLRAHAERVEHLRFEHAEVAHRLGAPQRERELARCTALARTMRVDQLVDRAHARFPRCARRDARRVEAVEIAPGGQRVGVADRVAAVGRIDPARRQRAHDGLDLAVGAQRLAIAASALGQFAQHGIVDRLRRAGIVEHDVVDEPVRCALGQLSVVAVQRIAAAPGHRVREQRLAEHLHHVAHQVLARRIAAQRMQAERLHRAAEFLEVVAQCASNAVESGGVGVDTQVGEQMGFARRIDDALAQPFAHRAFVDRVELAQQLIECCVFVSESGRRERRRLVADDHAPPSALHVDRLGDVVDDVRIDDRHVADQQVRVVVGPQATLLSGQPLLRAVRAEVHDGVGGVSLAHPEIGGEVEVVRRHLRVVEQLLLVAAGRGLGAHRLRQHDECAQIESRDDEAAYAVALGDPRAALGRAPGFVDARANARRQRREPAFVVVQRQERPVRRLRQRIEATRAVRGPQHRRARVDQRLLARGVDRVAERAQPLDEMFDRTRNVQVRRALVGLARRMVPVEERDALVYVAHRAQLREPQCLADEHVELLGDRYQFSPLVGRQHHRILQSGVLGVRQRERQLEAAYADRIGEVVGATAVAIGEHRNRRDVERAMPGLARIGIDAEEGVHEHHIDDRAAVEQHERLRPGCAIVALRVGEAVVARRCRGPSGRLRGIGARARNARCTIESDRQRPRRLDRAHRLVDGTRLSVGQVAGRDFDADHRTVSPRSSEAALPPVEIRGQRLDHAGVVLRVVDAGRRQCDRRLDLRSAAVVGGQRAQVAEQPLVVLAHAADVVVEDALRGVRVDADRPQAGGRAHHVDADAGQRRIAQARAGHALDERLVVGARCVDQHEGCVVERARDAGLAFDVDAGPGECDALRARGVLEQPELAFEDHFRGEQRDPDR